jgi:hypothetical protein
VLPALELSQGRKLKKYVIVLGNIETTAAERAARDGAYRVASLGVEVETGLRLTIDYFFDLGLTVDSYFKYRLTVDLHFELPTNCRQ